MCWSRFAAVTGAFSNRPSCFLPCPNCTLYIMRIFAASFLLAVTGICFAESTPDTAPVPRKAPEFVFNIQDGSQLLLSSQKGKAVVVAFMFTTCPHCQALCPT